MSAIFSSDRTHRFLLARGDQSAPYILFIGLNPSTADENIEDATTRKWWHFAEREGFRHWRAVNLSAFISTNPKMLRWHPTTKEIKKLEDEHLLVACHGAAMIVPCWGAGAKHLGRVDALRRPQYVIETACGGFHDRLRHLGMTRDGFPKHPLYLRGDTPLQPWFEDLT